MSKVSRDAGETATLPLKTPARCMAKTALGRRCRREAIHAIDVWDSRKAESRGTRPGEEKAHVELCAHHFEKLVPRPLGYINSMQAYQLRQSVVSEAYRSE